MCTKFLKANIMKNLKITVLFYSLTKLYTPDVSALSYGSFVPPPNAPYFWIAQWDWHFLSWLSVGHERRELNPCDVHASPTAHRPSVQWIAESLLDVCIISAMLASLPTYYDYIFLLVQPFVGPGAQPALVFEKICPAFCSNSSYFPHPAGHVIWGIVPFHFLGVIVFGGFCFPALCLRTFKAPG